MEPHMLGWQPLFRSWLATLPEHLKDQHELLTQLYNRMVPPCLDFVKKAGFKVGQLFDDKSFVFCFGSIGIVPNI